MLFVRGGVGASVFEDYPDICESSSNRRFSTREARIWTAGGKEPVAKANFWHFPANTYECIDWLVIFVFASIPSCKERFLAQVVQVPMHGRHERGVRAQSIRAFPFQL